MEEERNISVKWNGHRDTLLPRLGSLVDCTVSAEGRFFKVHRVVLSACSPYFEMLFRQHFVQRPIIILPGVQFQTLKTLLEFVYFGEASVPQNKLASVFKLSELLQIKGLNSSNCVQNVSSRNNESVAPTGKIFVQTKPALSDKYCRDRDRTQSDNLITADTASLSLKEKSAPSLNFHSEFNSNSVKRPAACESTNEPESLSLLQNRHHPESISVPELSASSVLNIHDSSDLTVCTEKDAESQILSEVLVSPQICSDITDVKPDLKGISEENVTDFTDCVEVITIDDESDINLNVNDVQQTATVLTEYCVDGKVLCTQPHICRVRNILKDCGRGARVPCPYCINRYFKKRGLVHHMARIHRKQHS